MKKVLFLLILIVAFIIGYKNVGARCFLFVIGGMILFFSGYYFAHINDENLFGVPKVIRYVLLLLCVGLSLVFLVPLILFPERLPVEYMLFFDIVILSIMFIILFKYRDSFPDRFFKSLSS